MKLIINGQNKEFQGATLKDVIASFACDTGRVIAELNGQIIKNSSWQDTHVRNGDTIELVTFVGGG